MDLLTKEFFYEDELDHILEFGCCSYYTSGPVTVGPSLGREKVLDYLTLNLQQLRNDGCIEKIFQPASIEELVWEKENYLGIDSLQMQKKSLISDVMIADLLGLDFLAVRYFMARDERFENYCLEDPELYPMPLGHYRMFTTEDLVYVAENMKESILYKEI